MLYTTPDGLPVPEDTDPVAPLNEQLEDMSVGTQAALLRPGAVASAAARDAAIPSPVAGQTIWRTDTSWREMYFTVAMGVRTAGWYPVDGALPMVSATNAAAMSVAANSVTPLKFASLDAQRNTNYSLSTGLLTVTVAGLYSVEGTVRPGSVGTNDNRIYVQKNASNTVAAMTCPQSGIGAGSIAAQLVLSVGDTIAPYFFTSAAQTVNVGQRTMSVRYIAPA